MKITRRSVIKSAAATTLVATGLTTPTASQAQAPKEKANPKFRIEKGRIKQSIMGWTFNPMPTPELAKLCKEVGLVAMEGISRNHYPLVKKLGMDVSLVGSHGFKKGPVNPANHAECVAKLTEAIEFCADAGYKRVITFTGMEEKGIPDDVASKTAWIAGKRSCRWPRRKKSPFAWSTSIRATIPTP